MVNDERVLQMNGGLEMESYAVQSVASAWQVKECIE
jgi:hypothetical protein